MKNTRALKIGAAVACLFALSTFASPYWELHRMRAAVERRDADAISEHVDFPSLRENIKGQLMAMMGKEMAKEDANKNPFAAFGQGIAIALMNPVIDAAVSPAGVTAMIENGKIDLSMREEPVSGPAPATNGKVSYSVSYRSWNKVAVSGSGPDAGSFISKRFGLWRWKLAGIELPAHATNATP
jgi:hypothetical protein